MASNAGSVKPSAAVKRPAQVPETAEERRALVSRAANGDEAAEAGALASLRAHPGEFKIGWGDPRQAVLGLVANGPVLREIIAGELDRLFREVAGPDPTPLERLLAERVAVCRMQVTYWERDYAASLEKSLSLAHSEHKQRRLDQAHRRYLAAIKSLAQVRRLQLPAIQVNVGQTQNIADKQVNVTGTTQPPPLPGTDAAASSASLAE